MESGNISHESGNLCSSVNVGSMTNRKPGHQTSREIYLSEQDKDMAECWPSLLILENRRSFTISFLRLKKNADILNAMSIVAPEGKQLREEVNFPIHLHT